MAKLYNSITYSERLVIGQLRKQGFGVRYIARALERSPSSISAELKRNGMDKDNYSYVRAEAHAKNMRRSLKPKAKMFGALEAAVQQMLMDLHCSPMQISRRLKKEYPDQKELHVSHQTIYAYIKSSPHISIFKRYLRRKGKKPRNRQGVKKERIRDMKSIHERPSEVESRDTPGHWEGDLIIGKEQGSAIGTLVERSSRYTLVVPIPSRDSHTVVSAFTAALKTMPPDLVKSLTYDQGIEMAYHSQLTASLGVPVFFADAGSPWQRGSNENTNGLIREFFPKKTDLSKHSSQDLERVQKILNRRPKEVLGFSTPNEAVNWIEKNPNRRFSEFVGL